jgi:hypothetical protein
MQGVMMTSSIRVATGLALAAALAACGSSTQTSTPTTPTTTTTAVVINAPVPVSPANGATSQGWPTLTVNNAVRTGPAGALVYRFDISTAQDFSNITVTASVPEGAGQTTFTPNVTPLPSDQSTLYWRAVAIDAQSAVQSQPSTTQSFVETNPPSKAAQIAQQQGAVLWPGAVPPGTPGQATLGNGWGIGTLVSWDGVTFMSPTLDELQLFDCMDRGMAPQAGIDWMHGHGYSTPAAWFPGIAVIGFAHQYMAFINGRWDMVLRSGA